MSCKINICFLGSGNMAMALAKGFIKAAIVKPECIWASGPNKTNHKELESMGCNTTTSNIDAVKNSDLVFITVKPNYVKQVLQEIKTTVSTNSLLVSIASGIKSKVIQKILPTHKIIRAMPNICATNNNSTTALSIGSRVGKEDIVMMERFFSSIGYTKIVDESHMDVITALCGSGPAFVFMMIEALADGAVKMGLPRDVALEMTTSMFQGSAQTLLNTKQHPAVLRDRVCSPAGTSIAGICSLEENGIRSSLIEAIEASTERAIELSEEN